VRPHKSRYWLTAKTDDPEGFAAAVQAICQVYHEAPEGYRQGVHVVSCDEKTGIQALERAARTLPVRPGLVERREFEYRRHGTLCLMANFFVATGTVEGSVGPTRTEEDFAEHIQRTLDMDPTARWVFVLDQLNTHQSEALVRLVVRECQLNIDVGIKGKTGILATQSSRAAFLSDPSHRIRFVYTPKHCSWLNQVEVWFSILVRRLLKRASFVSLEHLRDRLLAFIAYFNIVLAKPFKWTYTGKVLQA
jgi:hypothetical protein